MDGLTEMGAFYCREDAKREKFPEKGEEKGGLLGGWGGGATVKL